MADHHLYGFLSSLIQSSLNLERWYVGVCLRNGVIRILGCVVFASGEAGGVHSIFISLSSFARFIVFPLLIHSQIAHALQIVFHLEKYQKKRSSLELSRNIYSRYLLVFSLSFVRFVLEVY
jgi:hypothetical protein